VVPELSVARRTSAKIRRFAPVVIALAATLALFGELMVTVAAPAQAATVSQGVAVADSYVSSSKSNTNYGASTLIRQRLSSPTAKGFVRFNIPGVTGTVTNATLKLYSQTTSASGLEIRPVSGAWEESTVKYSNAPAPGPVAKTTGALVSGAWVSVDVTPLVTTGLVNLALTTVSAGYVSVSSREVGAQAPQLTITTATTTPPPPPPPPSTTALGMSYGDTLPGLTAAALDARMSDAVAVGVGWLRLDLGWDRVQPASPSVYDWSGLDRIVQAANAKNLKLLPILSYTPAWARPAGCASTKCAPADPNQFAVFASEAVKRYAPLGVHNWEVWNEPNITNFWLPTPNVASYVTLLRATAAAIRVADPAATIISAGLSPAPTSNGNISQLDYVDAFSSQGGPGLVDAVGYHPYSYPVPPGYQADWNAWAQIASTTKSFQSVLASYGYSTKKLWLTEYGAPTNGPGLGATTTDYKLGQSPDHVDEALQAQMATDSVALAKSSTLISALFWYTYGDLGTDTADRENFFGLRRFDGTPKPAYAALQKAIIG